MNTVVIPSSASSVAMSTKNVCNKENIRSKKYVPPSDDVDTNKHGKCQSPIPVENKHLELNKCDEGSVNETIINDKKKFVEAPLPKTNPWTANINAAQIVRPKEMSKEKDPIVGEKRVLLPQQQTICEFYCYYIGICKYLL